MTVKWKVVGAAVAQARPGAAFHKPLSAQAVAAATTIRITNGKRVVQNGPFVDSKEQLSGFFILEAPSIDPVLEWAAKVPGVNSGTVVEIRPILITP